MRGLFMPKPKRNLAVCPLFIALLFVAQAATAQQGGRIGVKSNFWTGTTFTLDGEKSDKKQVLRAMTADSEAYRTFKQGTTQLGWGSLVAGIGGALIGWPIGTALGGGEPAWYLAGIGAGVVALSVPIYNGGNKKMHRAADLHNNGPSGQMGEKRSPVLSLALREGQLGLRLNMATLSRPGS